MSGNLSSGETNFLVTGSPNNTSETVQKLFSAYDSVCNAKEMLDKIEKAILESIPDTFDMCDIESFVSKLGQIAKDLEDVKNGMTASVSNSMSDTKTYDNTDLNNISIRVDEKYTKYLSSQITLKQFQIMEYKIEIIKKNIQIIEAKATKTILTSLLKGKGSAANPAVAAPMAAMQALSLAIEKIMKIINFIVSLITKIPLFNIDADGMCFFMTPKSMKTTKMKIQNVNESVNNTIPDPINKAIAKVQQKINESNGEKKKNRISEMAAAGAATAGSKFDPGQFGDLEKFNKNIIEQATNAILMTLMDAEPVPRYEKLSITNIRFLVWLATGFVPAGKKSFGIPGFP